MSKKQQRDKEKERFWRGVIAEAARSGMSIREFCRKRKLKEGQFYWWQRVLKERRQDRMMRRRGKTHARDGGSQASFALVSEERGSLDAGIELVLADGRRIRIARGVDEETLRTVLAAMEREGC
jgi:hypothetical protein